jgi:hypothetical protein
MNKHPPTMTITEIREYGKKMKSSINVIEE